MILKIYLYGLKTQMLCQNQVHDFRIKMYTGKHALSPLVAADYSNMTHFISLIP